MQPIEYKVTFDAERYFENDEVQYTDESAQEEFENLIGFKFHDVIYEESEPRIDNRSGEIEGYDVVLKVEYRGQLKPMSALPDSADSIALAIVSDFYEDCRDVLMEIESIRNMKVEFADSDATSFTYQFGRSR